MVKGRRQGFKKNLWSTCDILQLGQMFLLLKEQLPSSALYSSEQQTAAKFAASSRHLRNSRVLTPWLEKQGDRSFNTHLITEEVSNNLALL